MIKLAKDVDFLYWMGRSINGMSEQELKFALMDANEIIDQQKNELYKLRTKDDVDMRPF